MEQTKTEAIAVFEIALARLETSAREPDAWTEHNLLEALAWITSGQYDSAITRIEAAARSPSPAEVSSIERRELLKKADIRDRFEDLRSGRN